MINTLKCLTFLLITTFNTLAEDGNKNELYKEQILGTWINSPKENNSMGSIEYKKDGSLFCKAIIKTGDDTRIIELIGTWTIENSILTATITKTTHAELLPVGHVSKDSIIDINDKTFKYKTSHGIIKIQTKKANKSQ